MITLKLHLELIAELKLLEFAINYAYNSAPEFSPERKALETGQERIQALHDLIHEAAKDQ